MQGTNNMKYQILSLFIAISSILFPIYSQNTVWPIETVNGIAYYVYKVAASEGMYSISKKFNIQQDEILEHNPELQNNGLKVNQQVLIPVNKKTCRAQDAFIEVTIEKGQTLYSLSKKYNTTVEDILKANDNLSITSFNNGKTIRIPVNTTSADDQTNRNTATINVAEVFDKARKEGEINVALILPLLQTKVTPENLSSYRFIEFYEGMLLSLEKLKKENVSVNLFVYDTGKPNEELGPIFNKEEMKNVNMIIGPVSNEHIKVVADYAERNGILLVLPFTSNVDEVNKNPFIFQINTPQEYLYEEIVQYFAQTFSDSQVTFLKMEGNNQKNKAGFISVLKKELTEKQIPYQEITADAESIFRIQDQLSQERSNVIVPTSGTTQTLRDMLPGLRNIAENDSLLTTQITLFGYPEWQKEKEFFDTFYSLNTYIYTPFYDDVFSGESINFYKRFNQWYSKDLVQTYPKYSMLGYDTGLFFFKALSQYGTNAIGRIAAFKSQNVQSEFKFEKAMPQGGYINKNIYMVHFRPDFFIEKISPYKYR